MMLRKPARTRRKTRALAEELPATLRAGVEAHDGEEHRVVVRAQVRELQQREGACRKGKGP